MRYFRYFRSRMTAALTAIALVSGAAVAGAAIASAATAPPASPVYYGCVNIHAKPYSYVPWHGIWYVETSSHSCPKGSYAIKWNQTGPQGPQGPAGPGILSTLPAQDVAGTTIATIGGSWGIGHTQLSSFTLPAGTYVVSLTGDFYQVADSSGAAPVLQIAMRGGGIGLTAYTAPFPIGEPSARYGVGIDGTPNGIEQIASASEVITLASSSTVTIDAFGYNVDGSGGGSGDFGVITHATFEQVG